MRKPWQDFATQWRQRSKQTPWLCSIVCKCRDPWSMGKYGKHMWDVWLKIGKNVIWVEYRFPLEMKARNLIRRLRHRMDEGIAVEDHVEGLISLRCARVSGHALGRAHFGWSREEKWVTENATWSKRAQTGEFNAFFEKHANFMSGWYVQVWSTADGNAIKHLYMCLCYLQIHETDATVRLHICQALGAALVVGVHRQAGFVSFLGLAKPGTL